MLNSLYTATLRVSVVTTIQCRIKLIAGPGKERLLGLLWL